MTIDTGKWMESPMPDGAAYNNPENAMPIAYYSTHPSLHGFPEGTHLPSNTQNLPADPQTAFSHPAHLGQLSESSQTQYQTLMSPVSSSGDTPSPWPAPEPEPDLDCYSYHSSPINTGVSAPYNQPVSPASWSSPMQMPFRQAEEQQPVGYQARMCSPVSNNGSPHAMTQSLYARTSHPFAGTPESDESEGGEAARGHEPYSKQVRRALLSFAGYEATVQQIYRWFRENTTRHENGGWQNSIRHNLSLNPAFIRLRRPAADGKDATGAKRGYIWKLTDEGVHGVQSTAKYRAKNKDRTRHQPSAARRSSGHRGGCATSKMKRRRQSQPAASPLPAPPHAAGPQDFSAAPWMPAPAQEIRAPLTPESNAGDVPFVGHGMVDFSVPQFQLPSYQISDVVGTWDGGRLFAGDFRAMNIQE